ncbi:MAG: DUF814 domain-containing protein, partial [Acidobacteria bacterium]
AGEALAAALETWAGTLVEGMPVEEAAAGLRRAVPGLARHEARRLSAWALERGGSAVHAALIGRLRGEDLPAGLRSGPPPEIDLTACGGEIHPGLLSALRAWYGAACGWARRESERRRLVRLARAERRRTERALAALEREELEAPDPAVLRRDAEALLAAGPAAARRPDGSFLVDDPWEAGRKREIAAPPGTGWRDTVERLYARARKEERGRPARAERRAALEARAAALAGVLAQAEAGALEEAVRRLEELGIAAREAPEPARKPQGASGAPRLFRSPGGFRILVGRSAEENDRLTFRTASPDDLWLHVKDRPGAHVLIRTGGRRDVPEEDLRYAARLAAALSRVTSGEAVDVLVARRRHLRRPRGGPAGRVLAKKFRTIRVVAGAVPDGAPRPSAAEPRR